MSQDYVYHFPESGKSNNFTDLLKKLFASIEFDVVITERDPGGLFTNVFRIRYKLILKFYGNSVK